MKRRLFIVSLLAWPTSALADATIVKTPYKPARVVFDFFLDDPQKIGSALYWIRSLMNPLLEDPYGYSPEQLDIKVVIHGTEIVAVAKKNEAKYKDAVDRMRYYANLGVSFKVCSYAAEEYGYSARDFQDFIEIVPNAITELVHWQMQGYALITPNVQYKKFSIEAIR
ncbi:DsrE family protein [Sulfuriferula sp. GW1]|uniref:DsrE family protein n=1 Tax=Sulfuriferula sp. GW1 TaxID=3345111 RepID=UPI0039AF9CC6